MSNKTQLQANNTQLASLIQTLQGKAAGGGGSSGGEIKTCTVVVNNEIASKSYGLCEWIFNVVENGEIKVNAYTGSIICDSTFTFENVVCGSFFHIHHTGAYSSAGAYVDNIICVDEHYPSDQVTFLIAPTEAGTTGTITIFDDD